MPGLSKNKKILIYEMIRKDFSDSDIARLVDAPIETIQSYRGGKKHDIRADKPNKIVKRSGKRGAGDTRDPLNKERGRKSGSDAQDPNAVGKRTGGPEESAGDPGSTGTLVFVGGKKYMGKKEGSEPKDDQDEYQCYNCDHIQGTPFTECPKCGASNSFDE